MPLVSICIVLSALILVVSLIICGFLYFSFDTTISRSIVDEDTYILIDSSHTEVSSIYDEMLQESSRAKTLTRTEISNIERENDNVYNDNSVYQEFQRIMNTGHDNLLLNNSIPNVTPNHRENMDHISSQISIPTARVECISSLHEPRVPFDLSSFP